MHGNSGQSAADRPPGLSAFVGAALDQASVALIGLDPEWQVVACNRLAADMLELQAPQPGECISLHELLQCSRSADDAGRLAIIAAVARDEDAPGGIALNGRRTMHVRVSNFGDHRLVSLALEAWSNVPAERQDGLTGLSDRRWFNDGLDAWLATAGSQVAVLMIDLDRFKSVNDSYGHGVGDALLQIASKRIRSAVRGCDVVSRLGDDEFAILLPVPEAAEAMGRRLVDLLSRPYLVQGHVAVIGASVGIALGPQDGLDAASLMRAAGLALQQAKQAGRQTVQVFDRSLDIRARARHSMLDDLRCALALDQFELHFQPQVNLASRELVGFEALVRWRHPQRGLIQPDHFIPLAEEVGLIVPIGEWVLRAACKVATSWPEHLAVAVNVSAKQLADRSRLPLVVDAALTATGLTARRLELEITESALMCHTDVALEVLNALRAKGVRVSMDDFGTGHSSLSQLRSFPFDKLKIDRSFIRDLESSNEAVAMVRAIAALGASLGMTTTAEGVETAQQAAMVRADGCTDIQGYFISRPVPAGELPALIESIAARAGAPQDCMS